MLWWSKKTTAADMVEYEGGIKMQWCGGGWSMEQQIRITTLILKSNQAHINNPYRD